MSLPKDLIEQNPGLGEWSVLCGFRGSIAHGMYLPPKEPTSIDDKDIMSICVPPLDYYFGLKEFGTRGTQEIMRDEWDIVIYEARKFIRLLAQGNPNVLSMLWLNPRFYLKITAAGQLLIDNRKIFVGRHVFRSFSGYAHGQLHRMTHQDYKGRMGQKRKELVAKFHFDVKNAAHLIRLLRMGIEFLKDGELYVERHDAQQLLEIKRGEWSLQRVEQEADRLFKLAEETYLASTLPAAPDLDRVNALCQSVVEQTFTERRYYTMNSGLTFHL